MEAETGLTVWANGRAGWRIVKIFFAKIIGADSDEVAFIPNTTTGINTVFNMLPIKPGQKIVTTSISYPMGAAVCLKQGERGAEIKFLKGVRGEIPLEEFEKNIDDKTSAVLVDQAGWYNGYLHDLRAISTIAHEHGAYLIVDAVQSAGAYPHNVHRDGVDFLSVSTYKWLLGGPYSQSVGYLYINRGLIDRFQPAYIGNQTIMDDQLQSNIYDKFDLYTLKYKRGITRIQIYPRCEFSYVAVENSMRVLLNYGIKNIFDKIKKLGTIIVDGLQEMGVELQTPMEPEKRLYVNAKFKNHRELEKMLYSQNIVLSSRVGG